MTSTQDSDLKQRALDFATQAHGAIGQRRKYSGKPYIVHPIAVAGLVESVPHTPAMVAAALLHDVVEDTPHGLDDLRRHFPQAVCELVWWLTDVSRPEHGNRASRKAMDRAHIARAPPAAKTIKLADLIDNAGSIIARDPGFARVYMEEKRLLLGVLGEGDAGLWRRASDIVARYHARHP